MTAKATDAVWIVDTGPLSHFARAGWLGVLKMLAPGGRIVIPDMVERELRTGASTYPALTDVLSQDWVEVRRLAAEAEVEAFARYSRRLVGDSERNIGECGVLALAEVRGFVPVVDDGPACKAAKAHGLQPRRTLGLLCEAIRQGRLTCDMVSSVADDLLATNYRIPMAPGGFVRWAVANGLIPGSLPTQES